MTIALDGTADFGPTAGDPLTNDYTPTGEVRGLVMLGVQHSTDVDLALDDTYVTGVTYGGVSMEAIELSPFAHDVEAGTVVEPATNGVGNMWGFFLGSGIPTGEQEIVVDLNLISSQSFTAVLWAFTADGDTEIVDVNASSALAVTNPTITLTFPGTAHIVGVLTSGHDAGASVSAGPVSYIQDREADLGDTVSNWQSWWEDESNPLPSGTADVDWSAASASAGIFAVAIAEVASSVVGAGPESEWLHAQKGWR